MCSILVIHYNKNILYLLLLPDKANDAIEIEAIADKISGDLEPK